MTSLLIAGCSSSPGSGQPAPADAGSPAATIEGTPTVAGTVAPPEAGPSAPAASALAAATPGKTSPPPAQKATQVAVSEPAPPAVVTPQPIARESTPAPQPAATKAPPAPAATARAPLAVDIGGLVEVGATKPGLTRIGSDKCKLCHKVQFTSWAATAHAARTPPLDCESCHGAGSEYKTLAIMKDAKKARAAGLVTPVRAFCAKCHSTGWSDDLLKRAHAHKAGV